MIGKAYAGIRKACFLIALDNGGINRERSAAKQGREFDRWIAEQDYPNLSEIDGWLDAHTEEELEIVCCGGTGESEVEAIRAMAPAFMDDLLNNYFDEVC